MWRIMLGGIVLERFDDLCDAQDYYQLHKADYTDFLDYELKLDIEMFRN